MKLRPIHLFILLFTPFVYASILDLGFKPNYYQMGDQVDLLVNKVESDKTQLPFAYFSLTFVCPPMNNAKPVHLSLGEILRGDRIWQSGYDLRFGIDQPCLRLCDLRATQSGIRRASNLIKDGYVVHWSIDGLPGATTFETNNHRRKYYAAGFPMGFVDENDISYLYNHVMLVIRYHRGVTNGEYTIVGFEVYPKSVINEECPGTRKDYQNFPLLYKVDEKGELIQERTRIPYTYSVYWREDKSIDYESRWDLYYENESGESQSKIHWISFINSTVLIFLASLIVMIVMIQVLKKDIRQQSPSLPITEGDVTGSDPVGISASAITTGGWKNLANEVNAIPQAELLLTTLVSGGIQMLIAIVGVIVITSLNSIKSKHYFFNNHQGALFSFAIFCFMGSGLVSSSLGIILHKLFCKETHQQYDIVKTLILSLMFSAVLPAFLFVLMFILNFFVWAQDSSTALPFGTIVVFVLLFILIQCPLGMIGGIYGNKYKFNPKNNLSTYGDEEKLQRQSKQWTLRTIYRSISPVSYFKNVLVFGLIPFGIVYVELLFVFNSVWLEKTTFYYMYGFLFITTVMLLIIIIELTIVAIYISLVYYNDANWTWLSFKVGSSIAWYIYAYSIYYFITVLNIDDFVSSLLYFSYMGLACFIISIACGAVGVITGLLFIRKIYGAVKLE
ncbi:endosomal transmembrane protein [Candida orthopsilosis Co 90-125]|uniref:Transmembrane 9 superfamily member n=1 Tax=Candida orthopsilosis (strain 90-125) TaxID=1136231 RepID=H8WW81_CANO9|nr:endosomal transmembrane protein [Candida orthopsilosis Co 90-125]CCG20705.1 endosomal transmembrane protein [Candida orthopsilosis Co 90-125]